MRRKSCSTSILIMAKANTVRTHLSFMWYQLLLLLAFCVCSCSTAGFTQVLETARRFLAAAYSAA